MSHLGMHFFFRWYNTACRWSLWHDGRGDDGIEIRLDALSRGGVSDCPIWIVLKEVVEQCPERKSYNNLKGERISQHLLESESHRVQ